MMLNPSPIGIPSPKTSSRTSRIRGETPLADDLSSSEYRLFRGSRE